MCVQNTVLYLQHVVLDQILRNCPNNLHYYKQINDIDSSFFVFNSLPLFFSFFFFDLLLLKRPKQFNTLFGTSFGVNTVLPRREIEVFSIQLSLMLEMVKR